MTDAQLVAGFEATTLAELSHREHVRLAFLYLRRDPLAGAVLRFAGDLRRFARAKGKPGLYHETITWAYFVLVNQRIADGATSFDALVAEHPELLRYRPGLLDRYYYPATLASERARQTFLMPDRLLAD